MRCQREVLHFSHNPSDYRPDIDGLRAVAVLSVLVYHAFPHVIPGGYVGVDVFFVISGYLISRIILGDLKSGRFTFKDFYVRRIRRIFPALVLVLACVLAFGWLILLPHGFRQLGVHLFGGAGFISNLVLFNEAGYFDTESELKPLLHLWSLGVEEQYYLIWPVALFLLRGRTRATLWMIAVVAGLSFALNLALTPRNPDAAFYLPVTRFWQLMLGSLIAYRQVCMAPPQPASPSGGSNRVSTALVGMVGALLIGVALFALDESSAFPGWYALLPTVGAALIVQAGPSALINRLFLSQSPMVYVGLISYPLYLWHWPVLTYARILNNGTEPSLQVRVLAVALSVMLAILTYEVVEKYLRRAKNADWSRHVVPGLVSAMVAFAAFGIGMALSAAQPRAARVPGVAAISAATGDRVNHPNAIIQGDSRSTVMFFGDSHMQHYLPRVETLLDEKGKSVRTVRYHTKNGCAPIPGVDRANRGCAAFVDRGFELARAPEVDVLVVSASWMGFLERDDLFKAGDVTKSPIDPTDQTSEWIQRGFTEELRELTLRGKKVLLVLNGPRSDEFDPARMVRLHGLSHRISARQAISRAELEKRTVIVDGPLRQIAAELGAETIDPHDFVCDAGVCSTVDKDGIPHLTDGSHFRATFVRDNIDAFDAAVFLD